MQPIFITGIGTGVGKTVAAAIVTQALQTNYWKPIQAGVDDGTDTNTVQQLISNTQTIVYNEAYTLALPSSPHIAAKAEGVTIKIEHIQQQYVTMQNNTPLVIEGAGGILVPINNHQFIVDIIKALHAKVILVSRNYLGSINHSLLTANLCKQMQIEVVGWLFNDNYLNYEKEISEWTNIPIIGTIPYTEQVNKNFVQQQALAIKTQLVNLLQQQ